tara:strand:- start:448 stop:597 length:150 start_codon:yes stop_codon:yes gene_type:complete
MTGMVEAVTAYAILSTLLATYTVRQIVLLNRLAFKLEESPAHGPEADSD